MLVQPEEAQDVDIKPLQPGQESIIADLLAETFRGLEYLPRIRIALASPRLIREGTFIAWRNATPIGCVGLIRLIPENWYQIQYLAVRPGSAAHNVAEKLLDAALGYLDNKKPEFLKGYTMAVQPYVDIYKKHRFTPLRKTIRVGWDLARLENPGKGSVEIRGFLKEEAREAADLVLKGLSPYWDWWILEQGGPQGATGWITDEIEKGDSWLCAIQENRKVGATRIVPDFYGPGEARHYGVYVLPEARDKGVGTALMQESLVQAQRLGQKKICVYTVSFLDCLAPGGVLYLRSGGRVEAEYLQLKKT